MDALFGRIADLLDTQRRALEYAESPLLLAIRLFWGWQFFVTGLGKLQNIEQVAAWFGNDLGIPMPLLNAYMAAGTEMIGGALLFVGLGGRLITVPLAFTMCVAYATSDREALLGLFSNPDGFLESAPLTFLVASLVVLVFGPGAFSLDGAIALWWRNRAQAASPGTTAAAPAEGR